MRQHFEHFFGFTLNPAPDDLDVNREIHIQIVAGSKDNPEAWTRFGPAFPAAHLDDLLHALHHAKKVLDSESKKVGEGYWPRRRIF